MNNIEKIFLTIWYRCGTIQQYDFHSYSCSLFTDCYHTGAKKLQAKKNI